jgi:hypothetical protein
MYPPTTSTRLARSWTEGAGTHCASRPALTQIEGFELVAEAEFFKRP